jgi:hypothetical protein
MRSRTMNGTFRGPQWPVSDWIIKILCRSTRKIFYIFINNLYDFCLPKVYQNCTVLHCEAFYPARIFLFREVSDPATSTYVKINSALNSRLNLIKNVKNVFNWGLRRYQVFPLHKRASFMPSRISPPDLPFCQKGKMDALLYSLDCSYVTPLIGGISLRSRVRIISTKAPAKAPHIPSAPWWSSHRAMVE